MNAYEVHRNRAYRRLSAEARLDLRRELVAYSHTLRPERRLTFLQQHGLFTLVADDLPGSTG